MRLQGKLHNTRKVTIVSSVLVHIYIYIYIIYDKIECSHNLEVSLKKYWTVTSIMKTVKKE
jgi:hypothetical protein